MHTSSKHSRSHTEFGISCVIHSYTNTRFLTHWIFRLLVTLSHTHFPSPSPTTRGGTSHNPLLQSPIQPYQTLVVYPHYRSPQAKLPSDLLLLMTQNALPHGSDSQNTKSCSTAIWHTSRSLLQPLLPHRHSYHIRPNKPSSANPF